MNTKTYTMPSKKQIFVTNDYNKFKKLLGNRNVALSRIMKIKASIERIGYKTSPILVNEKMEVIDGQGRLAALKELALPVEYIIEEGAGIEQCISMNINSSNWTPRDYINSYAKRGYYDYQVLQESISRFPAIPDRVHIMAYTGSFDGEGKAIKEGVFKINRGYMRYAQKHILPLLQKISGFIELKKLNGQKRPFYLALIFALTRYNVDAKILTNQLKKKYSEMGEFSSTEACLRCLSDIYNKSSRVTVENYVYLQEDYRRYTSTNRSNVRKNRNVTMFSIDSAKPELQAITE